MRAIQDIAPGRYNGLDFGCQHRQSVRSCAGRVGRAAGTTCHALNAVAAEAKHPFRYNHGGASAADGDCILRPADRVGRQGGDFGGLDFLRRGSAARHTSTNDTADDRTADDRTGNDRTGNDRTANHRAGTNHRTDDDHTSTDNTGTDDTGNDRTSNDCTGTNHRAATNDRTRANDGRISTGKHCAVAFHDANSRLHAG